MPGNATLLSRKRTLCSGMVIPVSKVTTTLKEIRTPLKRMIVPAKSMITSLSKGMAPLSGKSNPGEEDDDPREVDDDPHERKSHLRELGDLPGEKDHHHRERDRLGSGDKLILQRSQRIESAFEHSQVIQHDRIGVGTYLLIFYRVYQLHLRQAN